jgi:pimeloyl-ACP methyl ester carboxylesterase
MFDMAVGLRRDGQQWIFDRTVNETGKVFHFQAPGRGRLPASVKQHNMISKHVGRAGVHVLELAEQEDDRGHRETALELYFEAATVFANAQHPIFETSEEKRLLHGLSIRCYDKVRQLAPYPLEHFDVSAPGAGLFANLHFLPDRRTAPCVIFVPGCDMTKEMYPHPLFNQAAQRGMHLVSVDGPGQGECNIAGMRMTASNYADAVSALVDDLVRRPEIDADSIVLMALSFGTHWGIQAVARDHRIRACAAMWSSICDKRHLLDEESPRYKQLFAYITGARSEDDLDAIATAMAVDDTIGDIRCPTLLTVGEFDPRSPLDELYALYDKMNCPRQLWVHEDQHHMASPSSRALGSESALWGIDTYVWALDWLRDRLASRPVPDDGEVSYVTTAGSGPNGSSARPSRTWANAYNLGQLLEP